MTTTLTRRRLLAGLAAGAGDLGGPAVDRPRPRRAGTTGDHTLVVVFLRGGPDGCSILVPAGDAHLPRPPAGDRARRGADVIPFDATFGLHPAIGTARSPGRHRTAGDRPGVRISARNQEPLRPTGAHRTGRRRLDCCRRHRLAEPAARSPRTRRRHRGLPGRLHGRSGTSEPRRQRSRRVRRRPRRRRAPGLPRYGPRRDRRRTAPAPRVHLTPDGARRRRRRPRCDPGAPRRSRSYGWRRPRGRSRRSGRPLRTRARRADLPRPGPSHPCRHRHRRGNGRRRRLATPTTTWAMPAPGG